MENKYFKPDITDLRIGYECEFWADLSLGEKGWRPFIFTDIFEDFTLKYIRTPYLTKEQIEGEGWIYSPDKFLIETLKQLPTHFWFLKNGYGCTFYPDKNKIYIEDERTHMMIQPVLYDGDCPSINEFRYICKLLNIQ